MFPNQNKSRRKAGFLFVVHGRRNYSAPVARELFTIINLVITGEKVPTK
jgi:hypothetical protein